MNVPRPRVCSAHAPRSSTDETEHRPAEEGDEKEDKRESRTRPTILTTVPFVEFSHGILTVEVSLCESLIDDGNAWRRVAERKEKEVKRLSIQPARHQEVAEDSVWRYPAEAKYSYESVPTIMQLATQPSPHPAPFADGRRGVSTKVAGDDGRRYPE